jgi:hypothetical protein
MIITSMHRNRGILNRKWANERSFNAGFPIIKE